MIRVIALLLLILSCWATPALADNFRDFSGTGPDHTILRGVLLDARNVDFVEKRPVVVYGKTIDASVFFVRTSQTVPFIAGSNQSNVVKDIHGFYDLLVAEDRGAHIHEGLIESIYFSLLGSATWKDFGFVRGSSSHLVFKGPAKSPELVWIGGKLVQARLRRFTENRRDISADVEFFWKEKIRFDLDGSRVRIEAPKKSTREQFLQLYRDGTLTGKKSS